jgi:hypothetical protein
MTIIKSNHTQVMLAAVQLRTFVVLFAVQKNVKVKLYYNFALRFALVSNLASDINGKANTKDISEQSAEENI